LVRKEASLSAQIEGARTALMDLLKVEASGEDPANADMEKICGSLSALNCIWGELDQEDRLRELARAAATAH
jgi:hypothetical protein